MESDKLLETKLHVPTSLPGLVRRPRLVDLLEERVGSGVVLVSAPAGFGKTAVVSEWAQTRSRVGWVSLDPDDNDPARFWRYITAALDRISTGLAERVGTTAHTSTASLRSLLTELMNAVAVDDEGDMVIVFDDYEVIDSPQVHSTVDYLLANRPENLKVILTSRADPPLTLWRLRVGGQLGEIRADDLRFTDEEAAALLRTDAETNDLTDDAITTLRTRTEGWAVGLELAALSLRGQHRPDAFIDAFSGSHRYVVDFLSEEVLERQPAPMRRFLLETSILRQVSEGLCNAVTDRQDSQQMLEAIERAGLFLIPQDEVRGWWRYHQLFADVLRARLDLEDPGLAIELHRRAGTWFEREGIADAAIRHALAAGDTGWTATMIEEHVDAMFLRSDRVTLERWLDQVSPDLETRPRLLLAKARLASQSGDLATADFFLDEAEVVMEHDPRGAEDPFQPSIGRGRSMSANLPATLCLNRAIVAEYSGDPDRALRLATEAMSRTEVGEHVLRGTIRGHMGIAEWMAGYLDEGAAHLRAASRLSRETGQPSMGAWVAFHLGRLQLARGDLEAAASTYRNILRETVRDDGSPLPAAGVGHAGLAVVAYQRNEMETTFRHLDDGIRMCRSLAYSPPLASCLVTLAWARWAAGDQDGAWRAMEEAAEIVPRSQLVSMLDPVPSEQARLALANGDVDFAERWWTDRRVGNDGGPAYAHEPDYLLRARLLLARHRTDGALTMLNELHDLASVQGRSGSLIQIRSLTALALEQNQDTSGAIGALSSALALATREGHVRVFADEGPAMAALLAKVVATPSEDPEGDIDVPLEHLRMVREAMERYDSSDLPIRGSDENHGLINPLSGRELEVLELAAAGYSNRNIAEDLFISLDTVKRHLTHIFDKLGASNRTEASARARRLGLIS